MLVAYFGLSFCVKVTIICFAVNRESFINAPVFSCLGSNYGKHFYFPALLTKGVLADSGAETHLAAPKYTGASSNAVFSAQTSLKPQFLSNML